MSNRLKIALILLISTCTNLSAQTFQCGAHNPDSATIASMPYYGNGKFLDDVLSITNPLLSQPNSRFLSHYGNNSAAFNLPVKIWIFHDNDGSNGALTDNQVYKLLNQINERFANNNANIRFYLKCKVAHINNTNYNRLISNEKELNDAFKYRSENQALNWYFVRNFDNSQNNISTAGVAIFPFSFPTIQEGQFKLAIQTEAILPDVSLVVHEIGHTLGLFHTFRGKGGKPNGDLTHQQRNLQEYVNRNKYVTLNGNSFRACEVNGDFLCGTNADTRKHTRYLNISGNCEYLGIWDSDQAMHVPEKDHDSFNFNPPVKNFMAYSTPECYSEFTQDQVAVMQTNIVRYMHYTINHYPEAVYSENWYNRNSIVLSSIVNSGESQNIYSSEHIFTKKNSEVKVRSGSDAKLVAQSSIVLNQGFKVEKGASFSAKVESINDCDLVAKATDFQGNILSRISETKGYFESSVYAHSQILQLIEEAQSKTGSGIVAENRNKKFHSDLVSNTFRIYPNPSSDHVIIDAREHEINGISLYDMSGRFAGKPNLSKQNKAYQIDISGLKSGVYLLNIFTNNGLEKRYKIFKK